MEQDIHPIHHHRHQEAGNSIYLLLGIVLILPILWDQFGSDRKEQWHLFYHVGKPEYEGYSLYWFLGLTYLFILPVIFPFIAILAKSKHKILLICFGIYGFAMLFDHILVYSQSEVRHWLAIIFSLFMVWYHYKYE